VSLIQIPIFDGGLVTYADPEDIENTAATVSTNFETDEPGKLIKRQGRGATSTLSGSSISQITKWVNQDLAAPLWIYYETNNDAIRSCSSVFGSVATVKALGVAADDIKISNYGRQLRFANGLNNKAGIYQHIDREYFFGNHSTDALDYDDAPPSIPSTWRHVDPVTIVSGTGYRQSGHYHYKFVPIFDGVQQFPLSDDLGFVYYKLESDDKALKVSLQVDHSANDYNPRITGVKLYRSFTTTEVGKIDPVYFHVTTIPLNTKSDSDDKISFTGNIGYAVYVPDTNFSHYSFNAASYVVFSGTSTHVDFDTGYPGYFTTGEVMPLNVWNASWEIFTAGDVSIASGTNACGGKSVLINTASNYDTNAYAEWIVADGSDNDTLVVKNNAKALQMADDFAVTSASIAVTVHKGYRYSISSNEVTLQVYDYALNDLELHPLGAKTKVIVNHKYATYLNGRQFVGNIKLDPDDEAEEHEDWIIFSELLQPDVLPITNYIQIKDNQGGQITGLGKHLGSLVVFMERGIYRLDVPSTDPSQFSLMESEENFGCIAPNSIITIGEQTFFASNDNAYVIDPGFNISPITLPIQDTYQDKSNLEESRFFYDPIKRRMLCRFGSDTQNIYSFDINKAKAGKAIWYQLDMGSTDKADLFAIDENLNVYSITNTTIAE